MLGKGFSTVSVTDRIQELEERLEQTPRNKGTETARAQLKAQIAQLKEKQEQSSGSGGGGGYAVQHRGDATICLVGPPSVGKTSLLNALTGVDAETAAYEFTTLTVNPGMVTVNGAQLQLLDVPGLVGGAASGRGGGKQVLSVVRNADLLLLVTDADNMDMLTAMKHELADAGIYINRTRPDIQVEEKERGGLRITSTVDLEHVDMFEEAFRAYGFVNAVVTIREQVTVDEALAAVSPASCYIPAIPVVNKADTVDTPPAIPDVITGDPVYTSAETGHGLDALKEQMWNRLDVMQIFLKQPGEDPSDDPLIIAKESTVADVASQIHGDVKENLRHARVWGESADFPGQQVGDGHVLRPGDTVELRYR